MKIFKVLKIIFNDKKYGCKGRNKRVTELNTLLYLQKSGRTKTFTTTNGNTYDLTYNHSQFWYDNEPITFKSINRRMGWYHIQLWLCYPSGGHCGFSSSMVNCKFTKRKMYKWLEVQAKMHDKYIK